MLEENSQKNDSVLSKFDWLLDGCGVRGREGVAVRFSLEGLAGLILRMEGVDCSEFVGPVCDYSFSPDTVLDNVRGRFA